MKIKFYTLANICLVLCKLCSLIHLVQGFMKNEKDKFGEFPGFFFI